MEWPEAYQMQGGLDAIDMKPDITKSRFGPWAINGGSHHPTNDGGPQKPSFSSGDIAKNKAGHIPFDHVPDKVLWQLSMILNPPGMMGPGWKLLAHELGLGQREITVSTF